MLTQCILAAWHRNQGFPDLVAVCLRTRVMLTMDRCMLASQVGDVLLAAAFVSYAGPFNTTIRQQLVDQKWRPDLVERCIPLSDGIKPLDLLTGRLLFAPGLIFASVSMVVFADYLTWSACLTGVFRDCEHAMHGMHLTNSTDTTLLFCPPQMTHAVPRGPQRACQSIRCLWRTVPL